MTDTQITIIKTALDWAKAEMISSALFAVCGMLFLTASFCFWQFGKADMARAYIIPLLVTGLLLIILGIGLIVPNYLRLSSFPDAFQADAAIFIADELARVDKTMKGYNNALFVIFPAIIMACAVILMMMRTPIWQASAISVIAMIAILLVIDSNANARLGTYKVELEQAQKP